MTNNNYEIDVELLKKWLKELFFLTETKSLTNAIALAKQIATTPEEHQTMATIATLYRSEISGENRIETSIRAYYSSIQEVA